MQLFELVSPRLFRPLAGPTGRFMQKFCCCSGKSAATRQITAFPAPKPSPAPRDYFAALAKPLALDADGAGDEMSSPPATPPLAVGFCCVCAAPAGWRSSPAVMRKPTFAFMPEVTPLLDALEEILNPPGGHLYRKAVQGVAAAGSIGQEKAPMRMCCGRWRQTQTLNKSLRALNASIGHYIDRLTHNRTPQEVLELFDQYEEKVVAAAYHRFKTSDNLFNYRAYLEEELDDCEQNQLPRLALDYARVERCAPGERHLGACSHPAAAGRAGRDEHPDEGDRRQPHPLPQAGSAAGTVFAAQRPLGAGQRHRPAAPLCGGHPQPGAAVRAGRWPGGARLHLYPAAVFGAKPLYPPPRPRTEAPLAPVRTEPLDPDRLRQEQQLLLDYARLAVTEENVALLARRALPPAGR